MYASRNLGYRITITFKNKLIHLRFCYHKVEIALRDQISGNRNRNCIARSNAKGRSNRGGVRRRLAANSDLRRRKHEEARRAKTCHNTLKKSGSGPVIAMLCRTCRLPGRIKILTGPLEPRRLHSNRRAIKRSK